MKAKTKIAIIRYLRMYGLSTFIILVISLCAFICDKVIEAFFMLISFFALRYKFEKTFHCQSTGNCTFLSISIFWVAIPFTLPIRISLFANTMVGFTICLLCYVAQCYVDNKNLVAKKDKQISSMAELLKKYENIYIYKMNEDELRNYAKSKGLSEVITDTLVLKILKNYRWCDIMEERNYSKTAIRYHKQQIIKFLDIQL